MAEYAARQPRRSRDKSERCENRTGVLVIARRSALYEGDILRGDGDEPGGYA
jgi:hypothetical protein